MIQYARSQDEARHAVTPRLRSTGWPAFAGQDERVVLVNAASFAAILVVACLAYDAAVTCVASVPMIYLQILANGLVLGGLYACIAVGFSLVWGVLNVINILHGTFIVLGSYVAFSPTLQLGLHPFLSVIARRASCSIRSGYAVQATMINRVIAAPVLITLTLTFGLDLVLNNAMLVAFTADYRKINLVNPLGTIEIGPIFLPGDRVAAMALALLLTLLLYRLLRDSKIGRAIVAVRMDREAAALMGVDVSRINSITFGIGALMAGAAGALLSIIFPISPLNSSMFLGKAFVVCVLGGLGSVPGALVGGLVLGIVESFGSFWFGPEHAVTLSFGLLLLLLFVRPSRPPRQAGLRMTNWIILAAGTALLAALALTGDNYLLRLATIVCMYATLAQSWNFIGGFAGYPSFATAAFFGLGAYASGDSAEPGRADDRRHGAWPDWRPLRVRGASSAAPSCICAAITSRSPA